MNKPELIEALATKTTKTPAEATKFLAALVETIQETLSKKDESSQVNVPGVGIFCRSSRIARNGRNPRTGEPVAIPARVVPSFKASKKLKELVS